jgi:hypothetical protein
MRALSCDEAMLKKAKCNNSSLDGEGDRSVKKRKCLYHPALLCPSSEEPCIFTEKK